MAAVMLAARIAPPPPSGLPAHVWNAVVVKLNDADARAISPLSFEAALKVDAFARVLAKADTWMAIVKYAPVQSEEREALFKLLSEHTFDIEQTQEDLASIESFCTLLDDRRQWNIAACALPYILEVAENNASVQPFLLKKPQFWVTLASLASPMTADQVQSICMHEWQSQKAPLL